MAVGICQYFYLGMGYWLLSVLPPWWSWQCFGPPFLLCWNCPEIIHDQWCYDGHRCTGLALNSYHHLSAKFSVINTLKHRARMICYIHLLLKKKEDHLNRALRRSKYPEWALTRANIKQKKTSINQGKAKTQIRQMMVTVPVQVQIFMCGLLYTHVNWELSGCGITVVSRKGIDPSALASSVVNWMCGSMLLMCSRKPSIFAASMTTQVSCIYLF